MRELSKVIGAHFCFCNVLLVGPEKDTPLDLMSYLKKRKNVGCAINQSPNCVLNLPCSDQFSESCTGNLHLKKL